MEESGKIIAKKISDIVDEIFTYKQNKKVIVDSITKLDAQLKANKIDKNSFDQQVQKYLQGKTKEKVLEENENYINLLFDEIHKEADKALMMYTSSPDVKPTKKEVKEQKVEVVKGEMFRKLSPKAKLAFMKDVNMDREFINMYKKRKSKSKSTEVRVEYELYKSTEFGKYANKLFEGLTIKLTKSFPEVFEPLYKSLRMSGIKVLSKTYISIILLVGLLSFVGTTLFLSLIYKHPNIIIQIVRAIFLGLLGGGVALVIAFMYPQSLAKQRSTAIKSELPFMIIHMSAVSGSGAKPISIFKTILSSGEYPSLRDEVKKIVNYVNLFGYDLSTALKAVARRTPSIRLKDLLDGIVSNIESGGDLKDYLQSRSEDALSTYKLERKRYVDSIATYSDIYTAVLIAAPLLFFVTLAIIQTLGGTIAGVPVSTLASVGTFGVIPAMNIGFMIMMDVIAPK